MLKSLHIKNFAIIVEQVVEFDTGLNIIIGETGAGKSIILDAIGILLGKRASQDMIRKGEERSVIEGTFYDDSLTFKVEDEVFSKEFIIRKEIRSNGTSRLFLNDTPIQINDIKAIAPRLANYHSQDESIVLRDDESHIDFYDDFIIFDGLIEDYQNKKSNLISEYNKLRKMIRDRDESIQKKDFLEYQLNEINKINPKDGELAEINEQLQLIENSEEILESSQELTELTNGSDDAIYSKLRRVIKLLEDLGRFNSDFTTYLEELNSSLVSINELGNVVADFSAGISYNPIETENIRKRSVELRNLEKKYGTIEEILQKKVKMEEELSLIDDYDYIIDRQRFLIEDLEKEIGEVAKKISIIRKKNTEKFCTNLIDSLSNMGIPNAGFEVQIQNIATESNEPTARINNKKYKLFDKGVDSIVFLSAMNKGEGLKRLSEFASGGELSRILLSLKGNKVNTNISPVLILDEIDTGISGRVSQLVGQQMRKISEKTQIVAITHSPQIAAAGDTNFVVRKEIVNERTISRIYKLNENEKTIEIAKLISGSDTTSNSLESAKELINSSFY
ncbi:MAG: DNA repair protein RecN [Ignavibacteriae bacterium HGW-Ignavibacteriae-4]|jgi:DNA repair protein RecN (Recombination protein N)|nr:MAG: DNA repair protein RecN [Ignavibacteriae bacterium HGW-Ignavibacteriae-4]